MADLNTDSSLRSATSNIGAVVENLSNRKLFVILGCLAILQAVFFLLGGIVAPAPSSSMHFIMTMCADTYHDNQDHWFYNQPRDNVGCKYMIDETEIEENAYIRSPVQEARDLVFVAQMPHYRNNVALRYSPWFQSLLGVLTIKTQFMPTKKYPQWKMYPDPVLRLEVRMAYKLSEKSNEWQELTSATINRKLKCKEPEDMLEKSMYDCDPVELFELGSVDYPFYLINIRVPHKVANYSVMSSEDQNAGIGRLVGFDLVVIHQNGGFTKVWLSMKTVLFPAILVSLIWYWRRVRLLARPALLLEKALVALGVAMLFIDLPLEWLSLMAKTPFMLLLSDIRQGVFYAMLLSFWMIFIGEHLLLDEAVLDILGRDSAGVRGLRETSPSIIGGDYATQRSFAQESAAAVSSISTYQRRSSMAGASNDDDRESTTSTATVSKRPRFSGDQRFEDNDQFYDPRSPEFFDEPYLPPQLSHLNRGINESMVGNQDNIRQSSPRPIAPSPIPEQAPNIVASRSESGRTNRRGSAAKTADLRSVFADTEYQEEKKKSIKIQNELALTQIEYLKAKTEAVKFDLELKKRQLRGGPNDDLTYTNL